MIKTRDQSIFDEVFKRSLALGYPTYDYKYAKEDSYPFVHIESTDNGYVGNKTNILGSVIVTFSVWGTQTQRKKVSEMTDRLFNEALKIRNTEGYDWSVNVGACDKRVASDTSTKTVFQRGRATIEFKIRGGS